MTGIATPAGADPWATLGLLGALQRGEVRAAWPDSSAPGGWRVDATVMARIAARFADSRAEESAAGPLRFRDRAALPLHALDDPSVRIVPGGTSIRAGAHLAAGVVVLPPSFVNVGAWIGARTMIDSLVLVGSCAQVGSDVHLAAGVVIGGVLEPPGARPVIVEDGAFVGAGTSLLEGVLVRSRAVIAAGVTLTGRSRIHDLVGDRVLEGTAETPLVVPAGAVVVPGVRRLSGAFAAKHGLGLSTAILVKYRDAATDARTALREALR